MDKLKATLTSSGARDILIGLSPNASNYSQKELVDFIKESWDAREVLIKAPNLTRRNRNYLVKLIDCSWDATEVLRYAPNLSSANRNYLVKQVDDCGNAELLLMYGANLTRANQNYLENVPTYKEIKRTEELVDVFYKDKDKGQVTCMAYLTHDSEGYYTLEYMSQPDYDIYEAQNRDFKMECIHDAMITEWTAEVNVHIDSLKKQGKLKKLKSRTFEDLSYKLTQDLGE